MIRLRSVAELNDALERMAAWKEDLHDRLEYPPLLVSNFDVLQLAAEVKAFEWCSQHIQRAVKQ